MADWKSLDADLVDRAKDIISRGIEDFDARHQPDEGNTETDFIRPLLTLLGGSIPFKNGSIKKVVPTFRII